MKKKNFVTLILGFIGGILFSLGMCMALAPGWNALKPGVITGVIGAVVLLLTIIVRRKMDGKPAIALNDGTVGAIIFGIAGSLVLGTGTRMVMVFDMMIPGIIVGIIGMVPPLCLIPMVKVLK